MTLLTKTLERQFRTESTTRQRTRDSFPWVSITTRASSRSRRFGDGGGVWDETHTPHLRSSTSPQMVVEATQAAADCSRLNYRSFPTRQVLRSRSLTIRRAQANGTRSSIGCFAISRRIGGQCLWSVVRLSSN